MYVCVYALTTTLQGSLGVFSDHSPSAVKPGVKHPERSRAFEGGSGSTKWLVNVNREIWGSMLYASDALVVSWLPQGLAKMMVIIFHVCSNFYITLSENKTKSTLCRPVPHVPSDKIWINRTNVQAKIFVVLSRGRYQRNPKCNCRNNQK